MSAPAASWCDPAGARTQHVHSASFALAVDPTHWLGPGSPEADVDQWLPPRLADDEVGTSSSTACGGCHTSIAPLEFTYPRLKSQHSKINGYRAVLALFGVITRSMPSIRPVPPAAGLSGTLWRCNEPTGHAERRGSGVCGGTAKLRATNHPLFGP
jgi:hypothetical protein